MAEARVAPSYPTSLLARAPAVLRVAMQMLGDPGAALDVACDVLARRRLGDAVADDEAVLRDLVRTVLHRPLTHATDARTPLDDLSRRERVATVLAFGPGWDPDGVAEAMRTTRRRVRVDVRRALTLGTEPAWRRLLADPRWALEPPPDITDRCRAAGHRRRARRRRQLLGVAVATATVGSALAAADRVVNAPGPLPPTAHVAGLLAWPARGGLVRDHALLAAAVTAWRHGVVPGGVDRRAFAPVDHAYLLYAGRVDGSRLVVLQALASDGRAEVAVVADQVAASRPPRLRLALVAPIPRTDVPLLAIPGGVTSGGAGAGRSARLERLLVAPGIDRVSYRAVLNDSAAPDGLLSFTPRRVVEGLSDPWLDLAGEEPATAVRAFHGRQLVFTGILPAAGVQPVAVMPRIGSAPGAWPARQDAVDVATLKTDAVWWAQYCRRPDPVVQAAWLGGAPSVPGPLRMELVRCAPGSLIAAFLDSRGDALQVVDTSIGTADVYTALIRSPGNPLPAAVVAVGSTKVSRIVVGRRYVTHGRVAVERVSGVPSVEAFDRSGHRLVVL